MAPEEKFDPEVLQARWVLGGIRSEDLPDQAVLALEHGLDGTALQQLAGLVRPTLRDLESLPARAFADMGLQSIGKEQAADFLFARGLPPVNPTMSVLLESFPAFSTRWKWHIANWGGDQAGSYNDMNQFVCFVVEDLYETGAHDEVHRAFGIVEKLFLSADPDTATLIIVGFIERLRNHAALRSCGCKVFEKFPGAKSRRIWNRL